MLQDGQSAEKQDKAAQHARKYLALRGAVRKLYQKAQVERNTRSFKPYTGI